MKQDGVRDEQYMINEFDNYKILNDNHNKIVLSILTEFIILFY